MASLPSLKSLFINLNKEEQVDYILRKMPRLEYLNGLQIDRDELYFNGASDTLPRQKQSDVDGCG